MRKVLEASCDECHALPLTLPPRKGAGESPCAQRKIKGKPANAECGSFQSPKGLQGSVNLSLLQISNF